MKKIDVLRQSFDQKLFSPNMSRDVQKHQFDFCVSQIVAVLVGGEIWISFINCKIPFVQSCPTDWWGNFAVWGNLVVFINGLHLFWFCKLTCMHINLWQTKAKANITGFEIRVFCLTGHFWVWHKSHCSSPIAIKLPYFSQLSLEALTHFSYKEVPDLQKINLPCTYFIPYFSQEIPSSIVILFPTPLKSKSKQGLHFRKVNIPRGYLVLSHTHTPPSHTFTHTHTHTHTHTL